MASRSTALKEDLDALVVLERFLPYRLNVLASLSSNALAQIYAERFGLSIPAWRVVATLGQYEARTARDIAAHGVMHKSTVSRAVSSLEQRGLVVRRPNRQDRREEWLALTARGRGIYESLAPQALAFEQQLVSVLSAEEQSILAGLMDKLTRHARSMTRDGEGGDVKLYTYFRSSAAYRVRIALNLKGVSYESVAVNLLKGEQRQVAYGAINPQHRVPALDIGGTILTQSPAILEYLDEVYPDPPLLPVGAINRAKVRAVSGIIGCDIHPLNNSGSLAYLKTRLGHDQATTDAWYAHWVRAGFDAIEALIQPGPFAFGARPTMADIYLVPQVFNARRFDIPLADYPKIASVDIACSKLAAFEKAAPARQPDAA